MLTINVPVKITNESISDILWASFCQGSTYWMGDTILKPLKDKQGRILKETKKIYHNKALQFGRELIIQVPTDDTDTEFEEYTLSLKKFIKGLKKYIKEHPECVFDGSIDTCHIDSYGADLIVQYSLFGKQVFA